MKPPKDRYTMTPAGLKRWRTHLRLTQQQAADRIGVVLRHYSDFERGVDPIPLRIRLACAAIALGVTDYPGPP